MKKRGKKKASVQPWKRGFLVLVPLPFLSRTTLMICFPAFLLFYLFSSWHSLFSSTSIILRRNRLFPFGKFFRWLSYGNEDKNYFQNREFSFTLQGDIYVRFLSFANEAEMREEIIKNCPHKIDLGAVYNAKPRDRKKILSTEFHPIERELVFDIDMTDYDDLRTCCRYVYKWCLYKKARDHSEALWHKKASTQNAPCSGAAICEKCWPFMTFAIKVIDSALRGARKELHSYELLCVYMPYVYM